MAAIDYNSHSEDELGYLALEDSTQLRSLDVEEDVKELELRQEVPHAELISHAEEYLGVQPTLMVMTKQLSTPETEKEEDGDGFEDEDESVYGPDQDFEDEEACLSMDEPQLNKSQIIEPYNHQDEYEDQIYPNQCPAINSSIHESAINLHHMIDNTSKQVLIEHGQVEISPTGFNEHEDQHEILAQSPSKYIETPIESQ